MPMYEIANTLIPENAIPSAAYTATILGEEISLDDCGSIMVAVRVTAATTLSAVNKFIVTVEEAETSGGAYTESDANNIVPAKKWNLQLDNLTEVGCYWFGWSTDNAAAKFIKVQAEMEGTAAATFDAIVIKGHLRKSQETS